MTKAPLPRRGRRKASIFESEEADSRAFLEEVLAIGRDGLAALSDEDLAALVWRTEWLATARDSQLPPSGDWSTWLVLAGRGFGKTRLGTETIGWYGYTHPGSRCAVVGRTAADVRDTCFEGVTGLCNVIPSILVKDYHRSLNEMVLKNGTRFKGFSAEEPDRLRGPQFHAALCFPAETPVTMADGQQRPIAQIRAGQRVLTRNGPRTVRWKGRTAQSAVVYRLTCSDGRVLDGTPLHPVFLVGKGWTPLRDLRLGDTVCVVDASSGAASADTDTAPRATTNTAAPSAWGGRTGIGFTGRCIAQLTAKFRRGSTSTTSTTTSPTTPPKTSLSCLGASTGSTTVLSRSPQISRSSPPPSAPPGAAEGRRPPFADSAARGLTAEHRRPEGSAQPRATRCPAGTCSPGTTEVASSAGTRTTPPGASSDSAPVAARPSTTGSTQFPVLSSAGALSAAGPSPESAGTLASAGGGAPCVSTLTVASVAKLATRRAVYDLTVDGEHEFFANGILVHNCDEGAAWANAEDTWTMLQFGLRLGEHPRVIMTTTPRPVDLIRRLVVEPSTIVTRGSTYENKENLAEPFFREIAQYEGTEIGRQEIHGELIDPEEHGIFKRSWFQLWPRDRPFPKFEYIVMSLDTAFTEKTINDPTACTIWGVFRGMDKEITGWNALLCDAWSEHLAYPALRKRAEDEYNCLYGDPGRFPDVVLVEQKGSGITLCQDLRLAGVPIRPYNPGHADKVQRAHTISHLVANGLCWLPESTLKAGRPRDWCEDFVNQVCVFPNSKRFDYVDTFTQCLRLLSDQAWLRVEKAVDEFEEEPQRRTNPYAA